MLVSGKKVLVLTALFCLILTSATVYSEGLLGEDKTVTYHSDYKLYTIKKGDTLWRISKKYGVSIDELRKINQIKGDLIITGKTLKIPQSYYIIQDATSSEEIARVPMNNERVDMNTKKGTKKTVMIASLSNNTEDKDRYWLAKIIEAEAGTESMKGKIAVGAVVLNRVEDEWFPDTIQDVIFQKLNGNYQFTPVGNGRIYEVEPTRESYEAADRALAGEDPTKGALYFYNPKISKSKFFAKKVALVTIGNHQFFQ